MKNEIKIKSNLSNSDFNNAFDIISSSYWSEYVTKKSFEIQNQNTICYGIYLNYELIGFFRVLTDGVFVCYLMDLILKEIYRKKGIGSQVLSFIKSEYINRKIIFVSSKSQDFYKKNGFVEIEKKDNYFISKNNNVAQHSI